jgi:hypothetical protein
MRRASDAEVVEMAREIVHTSRLFREMSDRLFKENGQKPGDWKKTWESQIRPDLQRWYTEEGARREQEGQGALSVDEVAEECRAILRANPLFQEVFNRLGSENGKIPSEWKELWGSRVMPELRDWFEVERRRREREGRSGPSVDEVVEKAKEIAVLT